MCFVSGDVDRLCGCCSSLWMLTVSVDLHLLFCITLQVNASLPSIDRARADGVFKVADDLLWQCGVDLEACKNMIKAV